MQHSLYKYYSDHRWAEKFLDGELWFRSLAYFRDAEDKGIRGDQNEGTAVFCPEDGLRITQGEEQFVLPGAFESAVNPEEIFVFCISRSLKNELRETFGPACVEICDIGRFCARIEAVLPPGATFPGPPGRTRIGQRVEYYRKTEEGNRRWALPDVIAASKLDDYDWQDEFRLIFCLTDALGFQKTNLRLVPHEAQKPPKIAEHQPFTVKVPGGLRDICRLRE